jgi:hypothetical protein
MQSVNWQDMSEAALLRLIDCQINFQGHVSIESLEEDFDNYLNEINPEIKISCLIYRPSDVLKEVDPTAYRVMLGDYLDSRNDLVELYGELYRISELDNLDPEKLND